MDTPPISLLDKFGKGASVGALALSLVLALNAAVSKFSVSDRRSEDTAADVDALKTKANELQRQLDQDEKLQVQLKALADQNKATEQEVHDLALDLKEFEDRFLVTTTVQYPTLHRRTQ